MKSCDSLDSSNETSILDYYTEYLEDGLTAYNNIKDGKAATIPTLNADIAV